MSTPATPLTQAQNPWPGLFWYTEEQAHLFFGREAEIEELLRLIQRDTLTILFGRSGLGKTSLLRAGVFPRLRLEACFPVVLRLDYSPQAANPVAQVKALTEAAARAGGIDIESAQNASQPETLWEYFHRVRFWGPRNDRLTPVLVFDQFEEIFTLGSRRQEETDILEQLADLAENRVPAIVQQRAEASGERPSVDAGAPLYKIMISMREDFVWRLDSLRPILPAIMRNRFALGPLDAARGLEIIRNAGKEWVTDEVAQDIIDVVISSRRGEGLSNAREEVEPAYLNVMCNELFERMVATGQTRITRELVAAEKGGILESLYARSMSGVDDSVRRFVEQHLVTPAGFRATMPVEEARREHVTDADLEKLVERRLLRFEDRLGSRHVELAHDLLTGLVLKSGQQRKLRKGRARTAIWAALLVAAVSAPATYVYAWLAYVNPSVTYYATFMRRNGSYEVVGSLSSSEISHRAESLRVMRKGFRGEMQSVEAINGNGQLIMDSQLDSSLFFPTNGVNGQFCRLEFTYDDSGQAVHEVALDMNGRMVYALNYAPAQAEALRNVRRGTVVGADGATVISSFEIQYDGDGYVSEIRFLSGGGTRMTFGATVIEQKNTNLGVAEQQFLGASGEPVPANGTFVGKSYTRDARGDLLQTTFHDAGGNPVPSPDGTPPIVRWDLDEWGNQIAESYFDAAGKPTVWQAGGFQKDSLTLDDHGNVITERFSGPDGKPVALAGADCFAYVYQRDQNGNVASKGCLDAQGAPSDQLDSGYQKIAFQYDSSGRTIGDLYYGPDGKPVADKRTIIPQYPAGCYGWLWGYDQNFNRTDSVCLNANGKAYDTAQLHDLAHVSHEIAFDFPRAFQLDQQLVAQDPTPDYRLDLVEAALTADQFGVCMTQSAAIQDSDLNSSQIIVRDALLLACQFASGNKTAARATAASLTSLVSQLKTQQPGNCGKTSSLANPGPITVGANQTTAGQSGNNQTSNGCAPPASPAGNANQTLAQIWDFSGTRHYIQTSSHFQAGSDAWDKLFLSLQSGDGQGAAAALNQLQPILKN